MGRGAAAGREEAEAAEGAAAGGAGAAIAPYSTLVFDVELLDILG